MDDAVIAGLPATATNSALAKKDAGSAMAKKLASIDATHAASKELAKKETLSKNLASAAKMASIMATPDLPVEKPVVSLAVKAAPVDVKTEAKKV
jgi:hypothetical protein